MKKDKNTLRILASAVLFILATPAIPFVMAWRSLTKKDSMQ